MNRKGFTLIELMIVIAIIAIIAAIAIPGLLNAMKGANERNACTSMKTLATAQADFRCNDRDANRVNDFWTADVFGLYGLIPIAAGSTTLPADTSAVNIVKLIEASVAGADGQSQLGLYSHVDIGNSVVNGSTKASYIFRSFGAEDSGAGATSLMSDTDGAGFYGACHDRNRFAFLAVPEALSSGRLLFILNEDSTVWKYNLPGTYTMAFTGITTPAVDSTTLASGTGQTTLDLPSSVSTSLVFPASPAQLGFGRID